MMKEFAHFLYVGTPKTGDTREALWACQLVFISLAQAEHVQSSLCAYCVVHSAEGARPPTEVHIPNPF